MRKVLFLMAVVVLAVAAPVYAANISGTWAVTHSGPQGAETIDLSIQDNGGSLEISGAHEMLGGLVGTGSLKGADIEMTLKAQGPMNTTLTFKGKVSGNKMEGTREIVMGPPPGGDGGGQGGAPAGDGGQGGAPPEGGQGGAPGGGDMSAAAEGATDLADLGNAWSAVKK